MTAPTYAQFRTLALSQGWTPKDLAPFVQSDNPEATANRILYHLAGVVSSPTGFSWDDCPLPYPILCEVYHRGQLDRSLIEPTDEARLCPCGKLLAGRSDSRFCSDKCRLRAWRKRFQ
jgi:hypothetical protein